MKWVVMYKTEFGWRWLSKGWFDPWPAQPDLFDSEIAAFGCAASCDTVMTYEEAHAIMIAQAL